MRYIWLFVLVGCNAVAPPVAPPVAPLPVEQVVVAPHEIVEPTPDAVCSDNTCPASRCAGTCPVTCPVTCPASSDDWTPCPSRPRKTLIQRIFGR